MGHYGRMTTSESETAIEMQHSDTILTILDSRSIFISLEDLNSSFLFKWLIGETALVLRRLTRKRGELNMSESPKAKSVTLAEDAMPEIKHLDDIEWEVSRFGSRCKFPFHPSLDRPTVPNAGILRYEAGEGFVTHRHDFAQVWYVIEGECQYGNEVLRTGHIVYHADPHREYELRTDKGCTILFMQYQGHTTGCAPLYDGRMNLEQAESEEEFNLKL